LNRNGKEKSFLITRILRRCDLSSKSAGGQTPALQTVEKAHYAIFSDETVFPCALGTAGEDCKEALRSKASGPTAHVAGAGMKVGGLRPSDTSRGLSTS